MKTFSELNLKKELVDSLNRMNFTNATEVQELALPEVVAGNDVIVRAKTGTGKTGAFVISIMQKIVPTRRPAALIIVPTRELALQVATFSEKIGRSIGFRTVTVYGGASINMQIDAIRRGADIIAGTPGRIIDLIDRGALNLSTTKFAVLDEADTMLDMGFIEDVEYILSKMPQSKQVLLFSATMPKEIVGVAKKYMRPDVKRIVVGEEEEVTVKTITHSFVMVDYRLKYAALLAYINEYNPKKGIIFTRTKSEADRVHRFLVNNSQDAILLHGGLTQAKREFSLGAFKKGARFLIATNIASRGLDIADVTDVINFDAPDDANVYVHRVGRSARMGKEGRAFTMFERDQRRLVDEIKYKANIQMRMLTLDFDKYRNVEVPQARREERHFGGRGGGGFREHGGRKFGGRGGGGGFRRGGRGNREGHRNSF